MNYLIKEGKIIRRGKYYEIIKNMEWQDTILDVGIPINFKMPYFDDYAYFNWGDLIIIGAFTAYGKSTLSMNIVEQLVEQKIKPHYIYNEPGGRWGKTALKLGMKDGDFYRVFCNDADKITLPDKAVTIFDWVKPKDYAKTDELFGGIIEKLEKTHGIMICFVQLRGDEDKNFFAKDQIGQYPAWVCKYLYRDKEGIETKFNVTKIRDPKVYAKEFEILTQYNQQTKEVILLGESEGNKNNEQTNTNN